MNQLQDKMSLRDREADRIASAQQTLDVLYDMSQLLGTQLDKETLATCIGMIESGVNPEALAAVIQELRREGATIAARMNAGAGGGDVRQSRAGRG
ncbi:mitotic-spindle organizing gamma-tubulin ring associated-domain-containing protein [Russula compacta]|nr:mitotic-spindle organizing gamma-tubulin ring associated-domain-containing protein [Russula compacta]